MVYSVLHCSKGHEIHQISIVSDNHDIFLKTIWISGKYLLFLYYLFNPDFKKGEN
jgi:hypothetical protein